MIVIMLAMLACSCMPSQLPSPASAEAVTAHTVKINGEVVSTDNYLIVSDFVAVAENKANGMKALSAPFNEGKFSIDIVVPEFADDNQTIYIQVLSLDQKTVYGNKSLVLADLNETSVYAVSITVASPPPNYSALFLIVGILVFAIILASYILFTKWLIAQAVLRRANEIMLRRSGFEGQMETEVGGDDEEEEEEAAEETDEAKPS